MISMSYIQEQVEMATRKELLEMHPYSIWQGKDSKWRTYIPDPKKKDGRRLIKKVNREDIEDEIVEFWREELESPTLEEIFYEWLKEKRELEDIAKGTYDRYENDFKRFYKDDRLFGEKRIKDIDDDDVEYFLRRSISKHNLSPKGFANLKLVTNGLFKRAKKKRCIEWSITELIADMEISKNSFKKNIKEDYQEVYDEEEMERMLDYLHDNLDLYNLAIMLLFVTGLRIGEIVTLKWSDFNNISLLIRRTEIKYKGENKGEMIYEVKEFPKTEAGFRNVVIPKDYLWIMRKLKKMNPDTEYIFVKDNERIMTYMISDRLRLLCKKLNIYQKSPHKIRKTYGTILLDNKIDNRMVEGLMGHTDIVTTEVHYHRNRKTLEKQAAIISELPEFIEKQVIEEEKIAV